MLIDYYPIGLLLLVAVGFAVASMAASFLLGRSGRRNAVKDTAYECGMPPEGGAHARFSVKFYLIAMLFILFDIEIVFMFPWAVVFQDFVAEHGRLILWSMLSFISILFVGYLYALKKGAFEWKT